MNKVTFAVAFILTIIIILGGTIAYPHVFGTAVSSNTRFVFSFFLGTFVMLVAFGWVFEKIVGFLRKPLGKKKNPT
jgi:hypothetical protein